VVNDIAPDVLVAYGNRLLRKTGRRIQAIRTMRVNAHKV